MGITKVTTAYIQFREAQKRNKQRNSKTTKKNQGAVHHTEADIPSRRNCRNPNIKSDLNNDFDKLIIN